MNFKDELEHFRRKWKQDLAIDNPASPEDNANEHDFPTLEDEARKIFLEGVQHEENGELFEAIQKYRKAINLVPDIEFRAFEHTKRRSRNVNEIEKGKSFSLQNMTKYKISFHSQLNKTVMKTWKNYQKTKPLKISRIYC